MSDRELRRLVDVSRDAVAERDLVTPCCARVPELRDYRLWCPCGVSYAALAQLVAVERKR